MRRRRLPQSETGISLFPFMAVLICTMGTLIVILMVVVRQAKVRADTVAHDRREELATAAAEREAKIEQRRIEQETIQWRFEQLQDSREQTAADLAEHRRQLSHIEDHARRLEDHWKRLAKENETLEDLGESQRLDQEGIQAELDDSKRRLEEQLAQLEVARKEAAEKPRSYAIIPYDGPHGTNRRPIYIECRQDRVILQPEGIVLENGDFRGPLGPGNALAASLRAIREHWNRADPNSGAGDAYPLLIVRPGGVETYLACRGAMKTWDDEFGYELIDSELQLAFPQVDPALAEVLDRTVEGARRRQSQQLLAALAQPGNGPRRRYLRATPSGGGFTVESDDGGSEPDGFGAGDTPESHRQPYSTLARGDGGFGRRRANRGADGASRDPAGDSSVGAPAAGPPSDSAPRPQNAPPDGQSPRSGGGFYGGSATRPENRPGSTPPQGQPRQAMAATPPAQATNHDRASTDATQYFGAAPSSGAGAGAPSSGAGAGAGAPPSASLADTRGRDWALPHAARGATGVTRPIRVVCTADELTIVPQRGSGQALKVVPLHGTTLDAVDQFVSKLWQHIEEWQMAGPGLYWKPELLVEVAPGGRQRFEQLTGLLDGSGITVKQKTR